MKKGCLAFLIISLAVVAVYAQTTYEIAPDSFPAPARCYFDAAGKSNRINPTPAKTFQLNNASESFQAPISIDTQRPEHQHR